MKDAMEIEGKTIDEAIEKACKAFDVSREKLNIEILSEGSPRFFGLMRGGKALIKASLLSIDIGIDGSLEDESDVAIESHDIGTNNSSKERSEEHAGSAESFTLEAKVFVEGLLSHMGLSFPVNVETNGDCAIITIEGDGSGLLIGKGGQTLDAIQYITNKVLNKNGGYRKRVILDTEDYRKKRKKNLISMARKLGEKVKRTGKPVTVNPMNAHNRRIIHITLQDDEDLVTISRGEGAFRKIVILPSKNGKKKS